MKPHPADPLSFPPFNGKKKETRKQYLGEAHQPIYGSMLDDQILNVLEAVLKILVHSVFLHEGISRTDSVSDALSTEIN